MSTSFRDCLACKLSKPMTDFELFRDARGKHARRRLCISCIEQTDAAIIAGEAFGSIVSRVRVSAVTVRERALALRLEGKYHPPTPKYAAPKPSHFCSACGAYAEGGAGLTHRVCEGCVAKVDELIASGLPNFKVAEQSGASGYFVANRRRQTSSVGVRPRMPADLREQILELGRDGVHHTDIAEQVGLDAALVRRFLRRAGVVKAGVQYQKLSDEQLARAKAHLEDGASYAEAARSVGARAESLARHFPGYGRDREHRALIAWINQNPDVKALHDEIGRIQPVVA
jgi:hypothetical protein